MVIAILFVACVSSILAVFVGKFLGYSILGILFIVYPITAVLFCIALFIGFVVVLDKGK